MSKSTKQTSENKPPEWAAPLFKQSASEAQNLYASGAGGNTYTGSTVSGLSGPTMLGINQLAQAGQNWDTDGTRPLYQGIGSAAVSNPFQNALSGLASQVGGQGSSAESNLSDYASGKLLDPASNPYFAPALQNQLDKTAAQVQSQFSGMGRYGSGANTGVLTDTLGGIRTKTFADQFNRNQELQFAANNMIDTARQANQGLQGNLLSNAGNLYSTGVGQATTAADRMAGLDQQNFQNRLAGANATVQAGSMVDQQTQRLLADEIAKWYAVDNQDWTRLGMLQSAAAGSAGNYGTQVATSRQPIGLGGVGSAMNGLGVLLGKSDARLKDNIIPVGYRNGYVLWEFTYKGSAEKFRGVMAQMVVEQRPDAVVMEPDGFYAVDYARLGFPMERIG